MLIYAVLKITRAIFFAAFFTTVAHSQVHPNIEWKRIQTEHFELVYDARQQKLAHVYAPRLEEVYKTLQPHWKYLPEKITVVLNDRTDLTNGYATPLPYSHIMLFPVLPGPSESISEYGDWARELFMHEYTHILSFEQRRGVPRALSNIFGTIMTPNVLMSRWWLEGVAVDAETRFSQRGRLRSQFQESSLRAFVRDDRWQDFRFAEMNESGVPDWPYGSRPYVFGSLMWSEMIARHGERLIGELHDRMGGRLPYTLDGVMDEATGESIEQIFVAMKQTVAAEVERQFKEMEALPSTPTTDLAGKGPKVTFVETLSPVISPDGLKIAFFAKGEDLKRTVQIWVRPSTQIPFSSAHSSERVVDSFDESAPGSDPKIPRSHDDNPAGASIQRVSWMPDSQGFVFDQISEFSPFQEIGDLWLHELKKRKSRKLTTGLRAREPDVSPNGQRIAFTQIEAGQTGLGIWDFASESAHTVWSGEPQDRVSYPLWLDDQRILFSLRRQGQEGFFIWEDGKPLTQVLNQFHQLRYPVRSSQGILFTSTENGVQNLYLAEKDFSKARPLTHTRTGVFASAEDTHQNEFFISEMSSRGFEIRRVKTAQMLSSQQKLPVVNPLFAKRYPTSNTPTISNLAQPSIQSSTESNSTSVSVVDFSKEEDYSAGKYMWPHYWLPFIYWDDVSTKYTVFTGSQDPLGKHSYSVAGAYDTLISRWSGTFSYQNRSFTPILQSSYFDVSSPLAVTSIYQRVQGARLASRWEFFFGSPDWYFDFGVNGSQRWLGETTGKQWGPSVGVGYHNVSQTASQISPEAGGLGELSVTPYQRGNDLQPFNLISGNLAWYWSKWIPKRHVIYTRLQGQYIDQTVSSYNLESSQSSSTYQITPSVYLMRGYLAGAFLGKSLLNANLEYRFPIRKIYSGSGNALFFQRLNGAIVMDALYLRGFVYDTKNYSAPTQVRLDNGRGFSDVGAEMRLEMNVGYHFPMTFLLGVYWPMDSEYTAQNPRYAFGLTL